MLILLSYSYKIITRIHKLFRRWQHSSTGLVSQIVHIQCVDWSWSQKSTVYLLVRANHWSFWIYVKPYNLLYWTGGAAHCCTTWHNCYKVNNCRHWNENVKMILILTWIFTEIFTWLVQKDNGEFIYMCISLSFLFNTLEGREAVFVDR